MTKPRKAEQKADAGEPKEEAVAVPLAGLPVAGERAATILGMKLAGIWHRGSCRSLGAQWGITGEAVGQLAAGVDQVLEQLAGKEPTKRLVMHQLLLALSECDQILDPAKRSAARVKVCAEISKVTGLVKGTTIQLPGPPPPLTDGALK